MGRHLLLLTLPLALAACGGDDGSPTKTLQELQSAAKAKDRDAWKIDESFP
jgi:hypothetical protein